MREAMTESADIAVEVVGLGKNYGAVTALKSVSFSIESGKYYALLGPSGGGKTTLLRLIGGFLRPGAGRVYLHGSDVSHLPPNRRPTSMVFQNYALFPHMTVERNVAYGLKLLRVPAGDIRDRVDRMLAMVGLDGYNRRMPHELSGGQQQRVQLARSLVLERDILLLDEPLASLDARLRKDMCLELKRIQEKVGITFIHVTHNQEEALTVADRIAIIADGELVEEGTARDVYETPDKRFTAEFIGDNNVLEGAVADVSDGRVALDIGFAKVEVPAPAAAVPTGGRAAFSIRSELLRIAGRGEVMDAAWQVVPAEYVEEVYLGLTVSHLVRLPDGTEAVARQMSGDGDGTRFEPGQEVAVGWPTDRARLHLA